MTGKQKADTLGEVCPYCGKTFKRLKSHLNHCKMAPVATSSRSSDPLIKDTLLTVTVAKKKKKMASTLSQDKPSPSLDSTASTSEVKTKSKKSVTPLRKTSDKLTHQTTSTSLSITNPVPDSAYEDTRPPKRKWQGRSNLDTDKDKLLSDVLVDAGSQTSLKSAALGKVTLAAEVLKKAQGRRVQRPAVTPIQPPETHTAKRPLNSSHLTAEKPSVSFQGTTDTTVQNLSTDQDNQHVKPSRSRTKVHTHFPEEVASSLRVRGKDMKDVEVMDSVASHRYKMVKTSVWDHIKASLLSRKYGQGTITTVPLPRRTEPVIDKPTVRSTLAGDMTLPQAIVSPEVRALTSDDPGMKHTDYPRTAPSPTPPPPLARPTQSLYAPQDAAKSLSPQTIEWMSKATAGYVGMEVYRPPGRAAMGPEHDWMRPSNEPPALPKPPPDTIVSEVLGECKKTHEPPPSLNLEQRPVGLSIVPVPLAERRLADVTLGELVPWLADRIPQSPREGVALVNNSWRWYYRRYIDVRKGGFGGVGMLLAGYCLLSYVWCYPHLKHERWRKYH